MQAVFALSDRVTVLVYGRVLACGSADEIRNDPQVREDAIWAANAGARPPPAGSRGMSALLSLRGVTAHYGASQALFGIDLEIRGRRIRLAAGPQRHGQVHHGQGHHGPEPRQPGRDPLRRRDIGALPAYQVAQCGIGLVPEAGTFSPICRCARTWSPPRTTASGWRSPDAGARLRAVPRLAERARHRATCPAAEQQSWSAGRAADQSAPADPGRSHRGPGAGGAREIWRALDGLKRTGLAVLCIDKNLEPLLAAADRHAIIETGRVAWSGDSRSFIDDEARLPVSVGVGAAPRKRLTLRHAAGQAGTARAPSSADRAI